MIPFNKHHITGKEIEYINDAISTGKISGNGKYTRKCHEYFENYYKAPKVLLTTSCTDALEMCAILLDINQNDEVIVPSYTFVSSALAFVRQGAKIVFCDSKRDHPNIDENKIEELISTRTKAIVVVHYAGAACNMKRIMELANMYGLFVVEDAAQAISSFYANFESISKPLGTFGHLSTFSFHETKNIQCGEGGMLVINDPRFIKRAEIIWEKGTNRTEFYRGEVNKYGWVDVGSSFLPSEITAAFLWAQVERMAAIQNRRIKIWETYYNELIQFAEKNDFSLPVTPDNSSNNGHIFYLLLHDANYRTAFIEYLKTKDIMAVFHYLSLHKSKYFDSKHDKRDLPNSDHFSDTLVRLPLFYDLDDEKLRFIIETIKKF